mmetsp:Transcript_30489/g.39111  ORF Transcript_30489/g.39111 Transcript_30489/m.39111 type:complete len:90 (+) Transcript_30489:644-913(+)
MHWNWNAYLQGITFTMMKHSTQTNNPMQTQQTDDISFARKNLERRWFDGNVVPLCSTENTLPIRIRPTNKIIGTLRKVITSYIVEAILL